MTERATPFDSLKPLAGRTLEAALNRALSLDPEMRDGLRALDGRSVALHVAAPELALQVTVAGDRLQVGPVQSDRQPDLSVRSTLGGIISQLPFLRNDNAPPIGKLRIEGDADLARRLQRLAERFDPDWQQPFASVFGDVVGVQIANALRAHCRLRPGVSERPDCRQSLPSTVHGSRREEITLNAAPRPSSRARRRAPSLRSAKRS